MGALLVNPLVQTMPIEVMDPIALVADVLTVRVTSRRATGSINTTRRLAPRNASRR